MFTVVLNECEFGFSFGLPQFSISFLLTPLVHIKRSIFASIKWYIYIYKYINKTWNYTKNKRSRCRSKFSFATVCANKIKQNANGFRISAHTKTSQWIRVSECRRENGKEKDTQKMYFILTDSINVCVRITSTQSS